MPALAPPRSSPVCGSIDQSGRCVRLMNLTGCVRLNKSTRNHGNKGRHCDVLHIARLKPRAGELLEDAEADALAYLDFPYEHHVRLRTNNVQERANEEIKRRTKVVGVFPSVESMMRLVGSVLIDVNEEWLEMSFIDAASLRGVARSEADPRPIPADVMEKARIYIAAAIEERLGKAA